MKDIFHVLKKLNVLYAEDDPKIRQSTQKTLELLFKNVYIAENGNEALELFENENIHIVLLDYVMPKKDGYLTAKAIRQKNHNVPIIISSGYSDKDKLLNAIELNLVKYLIKPVQYDDLSEVLAQSVDVLQRNNLLNTSITQGVEYDFLNKKLLISDDNINLTKQEIKFIELLIQKEGAIVAKEEIEQKVFSNDVHSNTIRNLVYRLRKKIGDRVVQTVKDRGYCIK